MADKIDQPQKNALPLDSEKITNIFTMEELLTIPLKAVIDANAYAARTALDFIIRYGFNSGVPGLPGSNSFLGNLRMAKFLYNYIDDTGLQKIMEINIPFISLIPIPMLEVRRAQFDYAIQILSQDYRERIEDNHRQDGMYQKSILAIMSPVGTGPKEDLSTALNSSLKANMMVKIEVEKSDLPAGILQLLNLGQEAIRGKPDQPPIVTPAPTELNFGSADRQSLTITIEKATANGLLEPQGNVEVMIEVTSSFGKINELFAEPIQVLRGTAVGQPHFKKAVALTANTPAAAGSVEFLLTRRPGSPADVNGFIIVRANGAPDRLVYFNFE